MLMDINFTNSIPSPCVAICELDENGEHCLGCGRTLKEIEDWYFLSDEEKMKIIKQLPLRKNQSK